MGAKYYWVTKVWNSAGGTSTVVPNVQSITINYGRDQPTDDFGAGNVTITGILPDSLPALFKEVDSIVSLELVRKTDNIIVNNFWCLTRSLSRSYGTIANLDTWQFSGIGVIARMGQQQLTASYTTTAGNTTVAQIENLLNTYSIPNVVTTGSSVVSATTFDIGSYVNDIVQQLIRTEQGRLTDVILPVISPPTSYVDKVFVDGRSTAVRGSISAVFNDGTATAGPTDLTYTEVEFLNTADYLANTVIVQPDGLADQSFGSTKPVLNFLTLDQTTAQAANLAGYIKNTLSSNTVRPLSVSMLFDSQAIEAWPTALWPGSQVQVALRGTIYDCVVEGASITASPSVSSAVFKLSSATAYRFLRLDDVTFGTLDNNKLGF